MLVCWMGTQKYYVLYIVAANILTSSGFEVSICSHSGRQ